MKAGPMPQITMLNSISEILQEMEKAMINFIINAMIFIIGLSIGLFIAENTE